MTRKVSGHAGKAAWGRITKEQVCCLLHFSAGLSCALGRRGNKVKYKKKTHSLVSAWPLILLCDLGNSLVQDGSVPSPGKRKLG